MQTSGFPENDTKLNPYETEVKELKATMFISENHRKVLDVTPKDETPGITRVSSGLKPQVYQLL